MKNFSVIAVLFISLCGFSQSTKEVSEVSIERIVDRFPNNLNSMFAAHGTYEHWDTMNQLSFDLLKKGRCYRNTFNRFKIA